MLQPCNGCTEFAPNAHHNAVLASHCSFQGRLKPDDAGLMTAQGHKSHVCINHHDLVCEQNYRLLWEHAAAELVQGGPGSSARQRQFLQEVELTGGGSSGSLGEAGGSGRFSRGRVLDGEVD